MDEIEGYEHLRSVYFEECQELLEVVDDRLLRLDTGDYDQEDLNAVFRAVHSIKGGSGAFGLTELSRFLHIFENVLDKMRSNELEVSHGTLDLLFRSKDALGGLVSLSQMKAAIPPTLGADVLEELKALADQKAVLKSNSQDAKMKAQIEQSQQVDASPKSPAATGWCVYFVPSEKITELGGEPLYLIQELHTIGINGAVTTVDTKDVPFLDELNINGSYLKWQTEIAPAEGITLHKLEEVFEFVSDICELSIAPLSSPAPVMPTLEAEEETAYGLFFEGIPLNDDSTQPLELPSSPLEDDDALINLARSLQSAASTYGTNAHPEPNQGPAHHDITAPASPMSSPPRSPSSPLANPAPVAKMAVQSIRVEIEKIDRLVNMVGELVITQAMLAQQASFIPENVYPGLFQGLDQLSYHTRDLQESVMSIRAQPVRSVFSRMPRLVRDTAHALQKEIQLITSGEGTEVDRTVIEQLSDPLTHMIRNALDHGIEMPDEREKAGKSRLGTVVLSAEHRSGKIVISISDDGKGIDPQKIISKAKEKGLVAEDAQFTPEQALDLIFLPGLTTAEKISDLSGRGVGMDVVKRNIHELGGRITIQSKVGEGTKVMMSLPLTLAVLDGMIVQIGKERYVLPLLSIVESLRPKKEDLQPVMDRFDIVRVREESVPLVYLHELLGINNALQDPWDALVVVVEADAGEKIGLVVDELLGQRQVVIKSLENNYGKVEGCSAATILGDGQVALILDISEIYLLVQRQAEQHKMRSHKHA